MVERRKRVLPTNRQSQTPKRRRLNRGSHKSQRDTTSTRTSPRLSKGSSPIQSKVQRTEWEKSLPNSVMALDEALLRIAQPNDLETRDLCDEIADNLTQALFEDSWSHLRADVPPEENKADQPSRTAAKSEDIEQNQDSENVEPNAKNAVRLTRSLSRSKSSTPTELRKKDPNGVSPLVARHKEKERTTKETVSKWPKQEQQLEDKKGLEPNKERVVKPKLQRCSATSKGKAVINDRATPLSRYHDEGLVEEVVEIEEAFVDGGTASLHDSKKMLPGDVEEQVLDRSGTWSKSNSEMRKATSGARMNGRTISNHKLLGEIEEQLLDRSRSTSTPGSEAQDAPPISEMSKGLPWWSISDPSEKVSVNRNQALRSYVIAVIRTCARESWNADALKESYRSEPNSSRGQTFRSIEASLQLLENSMHMRKCEVRWRPELLRELLQRQEVEWSMMKHEKKFDQFAGCDACLGHRRAAARLWFKGKRYDPSNFWPSTCHFQVLTSEAVSERKLLVSAELQKEETSNDHPVRRDVNEQAIEFWVDKQCLRRCLVFHELVHSTAKIARDYRDAIEKKLGSGKLQLKLHSKESDVNRVSVSERLERHLLRSILHDKDFVNNHVEHLVEMTRLGDIYFSSPDAEVLDSGKPGKSAYVPTIYDAPLDLGDEEYRSRINQVVANSRKRRISCQ